MARICVIDDKAIMRESLQATLRSAGYQVCVFEDPAEALQAVQAGGCDLVLTDLKMPHMSGIELLGQLRTAGCDLPVIVMTAFGSIPTAVKAMRLGAFDYVAKPFEADEITLLCERALQHGRIRRDNEALQMSLSDLNERRVLVGNGPAMQQVRDQIQRLAQSNSIVLVQGESGTGKELVARALHAASPRAGRIMLCLNCAALSGTLLESELFGHEKGAFTGADRLRKGRFELADGGTLLLDEISEVPLELQAKLLRVLQEQAFERVGSSTTRRVDVRLIATTNRELEQSVRDGRFREDLYYRLNVLPIRVPPLRERKEDIPSLVRHFLSRFSARDGRRPAEVEPAGMQLLTGYSWPGNIRELENVCERAVVLASGDRITAEAIAPWLNPARCETPTPHIGRPGHLLEDMERQLIEGVLERHGGHRQRTARELGMGVRTLGLRLKHWREEAKT
jgi:two-component system response regulator HydG